MILNREPALILSVVTALITLGIAFGLDLSEEQVGAIVAAIVAVMGLVIRAKVTPVA